MVRNLDRHAADAQKWIVAAALGADDHEIVAAPAGKGGHDLRWKAAPDASRNFECVCLETPHRAIDP
jgi:hypothetical protein